ncbi:hypothetical protein DYB28_007865, partial [Aphanomyces astaci]
MEVGGGSADGSTEARETKPRFLADPDEATYWQRVKKTWEMLDFRTAFATAADVQAAKSVVLNQTYNALHYYANRNATNEDTSNQRIAAYVGATASSVAAS